MENIIDSIQKIYPMPQSSIEQLANCFKVEKHPKKHMLIEGGKINRNVYFIEEGFCRSYCIINGEEVTTWFSKEGDITFALNDLYHNTAGFEYVELLEDTTFYAISIDDLNRLYRENIDIANWSRVIHQEALLNLQLTRIDRLTLSASQRYEKLLKELPYLIHRVNLGHLASYLGMTQQNLSKIRGGK